MYGHVWLCMVMYGLVMYDHMWPCMVMYGNVLSCMVMCAHGGLCMVKYAHVWACILMYDVCLSALDGSLLAKL